MPCCPSRRRSRRRPATASDQRAERRGGELDDLAIGGDGVLAEALLDATLDVVAVVACGVGVVPEHRGQEVAVCAQRPEGVVGRRTGALFSLPCRHGVAD